MFFNRPENLQQKGNAAEKQQDKKVWDEETGLPAKCCYFGKAYPKRAKKRRFFWQERNKKKVIRKQE
jgi:hypothetical protein